MLTFNILTNVVPRNRSYAGPTGHSYYSVVRFHGCAEVTYTTLQEGINIERFLYHPRQTVWITLSVCAVFTLVNILSKVNIYERFPNNSYRSWNRYHFNVHVWRIWSDGKFVVRGFLVEKEWAIIQYHVEKITTLQNKVTGCVGRNARVFARQNPDPNTWTDETEILVRLIQQMIQP